MLSQFTALDYFVFSFITVASFYAAWLGHRKSTDVLEYALMGRRLTLPLFVATLVATWYGGILGVAEIAYAEGMFSFITQGLFWYLAYLVFAVFFAEKLHASGAVTSGDFVGQKLGRHARTVVALFSFIDVIPISYVLSLEILGKEILNIPGLGIIGTLLVGAYVLSGGFRSVVYSDVVQFGAMMLGVVVVPVFAWGTDHWNFSNLKPHYFEPTGSVGWLQFIMWGFLALGTFVDPNFHQRCFAAPNGKTAKRGVYISIVCWIIFDLSLTSGAMLAAANGAPSYVSYAVSMLPSGFRGLFLAGLLATILSTLDSYLFVGGQTLANDLTKYPESKNVHKLGVLVSTMMAIGLSLVFDSIKDVWKTLGAYSAGCLLLPLSILIFRASAMNSRLFHAMIYSSVIAVTVWKLGFKEMAGTLEIPSLFTGLFVGIIVLIGSKAFKIFGRD